MPVTLAPAAAASVFNTVPPCQYTMLDLENAVRAALAAESVSVVAQGRCGSLALSAHPATHSLSGLWALYVGAAPEQHMPRADLHAHLVHTLAAYLAMGMTVAFQ